MNTIPLTGGITTTFCTDTLQSTNYKQSSRNHDSEPPAKRFKGEEPQILLSDHQVAIVPPIMASRFQQMVATYCHWRRNGFVIAFVFKKDEEKEIISILQQHAPDMMNSFILHPYMSNPSNAGIAKGAAYDFILQNYLDDPNVKFAVLPDDTVDNIVNTSTEESIMTNPTEFYNTVTKFAEKSPIFGGTVAYERHKKKHRKKQCQKKCQQEDDEPARVERGFLQQALVFSCRGAPTLIKHFKNAEEYMITMQKLRYRNVRFGEDISLQIALYEHEVLRKGKSAQFRGLEISRIEHKSATKLSFDNLDDEAKDALKDTMLYLKQQEALSINNNKLSGVMVIPGINKSFISIEGRRPWREVYEYAFPSSKES